MYCGLLALCHLRRLEQSGRIHLTDGQHLRFSLYPFVYLYLGLGSNRFFKNFLVVKMFSMFLGQTVLSARHLQHK